MLSEQNLDHTGKYVDTIDQKIKRDKKSGKCFKFTEKGIVIYYTKSKRIYDSWKNQMRQKMQKTSVAVQKDWTQQSRSVSSSSDGDDITKKPTFRYEQRSIGEPTFCNPWFFR